MAKMQHIRIEELLLKEIADYRFSNRIESRQEAIVELIKKGLAKTKK